MFTVSFEAASAEMRSLLFLPRQCRTARLFWRRYHPGRSSARRSYTGRSPRCAPGHCRRRWRCHGVGARVQLHQPGVSCLRCLSRLHQQKCGVCYFCRVSVAPRACFGDGTTELTWPRSVGPNVPDFDKTQRGASWRACAAASASEQKLNQL